MQVFGSVVVAAISFLSGLLVSFLWFKRNIASYQNEARLKAKAIEDEALLKLKEAQLQIKRLDLQAKEQRHLQERELQEEKKALLRERKELETLKEQVRREQNGIRRYEEKLRLLEKEKRDAIEAALSVAEGKALMSRGEAKRYMLEKLKEQSAHEAAMIVRKYEMRAKEEARAKANYILAQATSRYAGEFAGERLVDTVALPGDEHKGRIIGKEGRNIKALEQLLGVDIIIDETPQTITVSSFNLYRRAVAVKVLEVLVEDGRIHPGRIEEVYENVMEGFDREMLEEGERVAMELGVFGMREELLRLLGKLRYRASYGQNALAHTLEVARMAGIIAAELGGDEKLAVRAGLLHDIGKALTQEQGGSHVQIGVALCKKYGEHPTVINAIYAHHEYEEPDSIESAAVCAADTLSAARPGARREVMQQYLKRLKEIEAIATSKEGVRQAYAIHAGRELRVIVDATKLDDAQIVLLSREIAEEIEKNVRYPGEIKVNVIRESRATSIAK